MLFRNSHGVWTYRYLPHRVIGPDIAHMELDEAERDCYNTEDKGERHECTGASYLITPYTIHTETLNV